MSRPLADERGLQHVESHVLSDRATLALAEQSDVREEKRVQGRGHSLHFAWQRSLGSMFCEQFTRKPTIRALKRLSSERATFAPSRESLAGSRVLLASPGVSFTSSRVRPAGSRAPFARSRAVDTRRGPTISP